MRCEISTHHTKAMFFAFERHIQNIERSIMWRFIKDYLFSIIFILGVVYISLSNPPALKIPLFRGWDKVVHFCMYGGMSCVIWIEFLIKNRKRKTNIILSVTGVILTPVIFGGVMELCQHYFSRSRSGDWMDFWANTGGVITATLIAWFILRPLMMKNQASRIK